MSMEKLSQVMDDTVSATIDQLAQMRNEADECRQRTINQAEYDYTVMMQHIEALEATIIGGGKESSDE